MNKRTLFLTGFTLAAIAAAASTGISLYRNRNQISITQYDISGDASAAEGISYQLLLYDTDSQFTAAISNTVGEEASAFYRSTAADPVLDYYNYGDYSFRISYGMHSSELSLSSFEGHEFLTAEDVDWMDCPDSVLEMVNDCAALTQSGETRKFQVDLKDYAEEMPFTIYWDYESGMGDVELSQIRDTDVWSEFVQQFSLPLLDSYPVNITITKSGNGNLRKVNIQPLYHGDPIEACGTSQSGRAGEEAYIFLYGISANAETEIYDSETDQSPTCTDAYLLWKNTIAYLQDSGKSGLYTLQFHYTGLTEGGKSGQDTTLNEITLRKLSDMPENKGYLQVLPTGSGDYYSLYETENGYLVQGISEEGDSGSLEIPASPEDTYYGSPSVFPMQDGICVIQGDGHITVFGMNEKKELSILLSTQLVSDSEGANAEYPFDYAPSATNSATLYKDGKLAFVSDAYYMANTICHPGSVCLTIYDAGGLVYAGYFENQYTTYQNTGAVGIFYAEDGMEIQYGSIQAQWD